MATRKPFSDLSRSGKWRRLNNERRYTESNCILSEIPDQNAIAGPSVEAQPQESSCSSNRLGPVWDEMSESETDYSSIESEDTKDSSSWERIQKKETLADELREWALHFTVDNVVISALLCILKKNGVVNQSLPSDARTFLKTPVAIETKAVPPGLYSHIGIKKNLENIWHRVKETVDCIQLLVGIDGLPIFKSGTGEFWPILGSVLNIPTIAASVFPVGVYYGKKKPSCCKAFLANFISELKSCMENGIVLKGKRYLIEVKGFCCDAPAKAFLLGVKGHTGYSSCTKCKQEGKYYNGKVIFPDIPNQQSLLPVLRTSEGFLQQHDPAHHNTESPLIDIPGLNFITAFPLDYMHLVCLGVMRSLLYIWIFKIPHKLPHRLVDIISSRLISLKMHIPKEFCRRPRCLNEIKRWKATEFRQFLLYTGPIVLKDILNPDLYNNFLELHVAVRILSSLKYCEALNLYAHDLLTHFLHSFKAIYGQSYMTHNFHGLIHLAENTATFGPLDNCSTFKFENYLHSIKKLIRKGDKPLQQLIKRLEEKSHSFPISTSDYDYPYCSYTKNSDQVKTIHFKDFILSSSSPNCYCRLKDGSVVAIRNIVKEAELPTIIYNKFNQSEDFFGSPLCKSGYIGISCVSGLTNQVEICVLSDIEEKIVILPIPESDKLLALPLTHAD